MQGKKGMDQGDREKNDRDDLGTGDPRLRSSLTERISLTIQRVRYLCI